MACCSVFNNIAFKIVKFKLFIVLEVFVDNIFCSFTTFYNFFDLIFNKFIINLICD